MLSKIYHSIKRKTMLKAIKPYCTISNESVYGDGFDVELRDAVAGRSDYLTVGKNCVIDGRFVFETSEGRIIIGDRCHIGGSTFISRAKIVVGDDVTIAWGCTIYDHNSHSVNWAERKNDTLTEYNDTVHYKNPLLHKDWSVVKTAPITIGDRAWIGCNCHILKGVTIGEGAVIGAGSVVTKDVEPYCIYGGNPAVKIKEIKMRNE